MRRVVLAVLAVLPGWTGVARAQNYVVDQQCLPEIWGTYSIPLGAPIGQEFVPKFGSLTFVDLRIVNGPGLPMDTAQVFVAIRADGFGGTEIGTSFPVHIPYPFDGEVRLVFPGALAVEVGRMHFIEARSTGPGNPMLGEGAEFDICPGIRGYFLGQGFINGVDFLYRTGIDTTPVRRGSWGGVKIRYR